MNRWVYFNPNPVRGQRVGDCSIRALCKALDITWEDAFMGVMVQACELSDMPSANVVWGSYLRKNGFKRYLVDDHDQYVYTVEDFCRDHPKGTYVLCIDGHVVTAIDGKYYDSWESGEEVPIYYFAKEE